MPFIPTNTKCVINGRVMGGTMRRKVAKRTKPWLLPASATAGNPALQPPQLEEDDLPPAKKARLQSPSSISTTVDRVTTEHTAERVTTDLPDDSIPTDPVTVADSLESAAASPGAPPRSWTPAEDTKLTEAIKKHGKKWVAVATMVPGRTDQQCRRRWIQTLDTAWKTAGQWNGEEDAKLIDAVKKHGKKWVAIATLVPGRTDIQCRQRWTQTLDPSNGKNKGRWKPDEDTKLIEAVKKHAKNWVAVATLVPGRTDLQCRFRWVNMVEHANGKTMGRWKPEEDTKLIEAVKKHGKKWVAVAAMVPGRTDRQCRQRWVNMVDHANGK
jgi:hypothetical protein